jgi:hypothetical protein
MTSNMQMMGRLNTKEGMKRTRSTGRSRIDGKKQNRRERIGQTKSKTMEELQRRTVRGKESRKKSIEKQSNIINPN